MVRVDEATFVPIQMETKMSRKPVRTDDLCDPGKLGGGEGMDMNAMMKKAVEMQRPMEQFQKDDE